MTWSEALDWRRATVKACFGLETNINNTGRMSQSFREWTSVLCHFAPAEPTQSGAVLCQITQYGVTSTQYGAVLCRIRYSGPRSFSPRTFRVASTWHSTATHTAHPVCVVSFCSVSVDNKKDDKNKLIYMKNQTTLLMFIPPIMHLIYSTLVWKWTIYLLSLPLILKKNAKLSNIPIVLSVIQQA